MLSASAQNSITQDCSRKREPANHSSENDPWQQLGVFREMVGMTSHQQRIIGWCGECSGELGSSAPIPRFYDLLHVIYLYLQIRHFLLERGDRHRQRDPSQNESDRQCCQNRY